MGKFCVIVFETSRGINLPFLCREQRERQRERERDWATVGGLDVFYTAKFFCYSISPVVILSAL